MRLCVLAVFGLRYGGSLIAAEAKDDTAKELKNFKSDYVMVSGEVKGEKLPDKTVKTATITIEGDKHTVKVGDDTIIGTHKLAPTKKPKEIDSSDTEGPLKGKTYLGIYKFEDGVFTVCFAEPGKDRPKEFTTKSGTGELLHVWKKK